MKYLPIPNYSRYHISRCGELFDSHRGIVKNFNLHRNGYLQTGIITDCGKKTTLSKHRALALTYIKKPSGIDKLVVNHKNGIKTDNDLSNLEWVTQRDNVIHAGENNLTSKCIPIQVLMMDTDEVLEFPSAISCAEFFSVTKDFILYRLRFGNDRVFPERRRYKRKHEDWLPVNEEEYSLFKYGVDVAVIVRDFKRDIVKEFNTLTSAAEWMGVSIASASVWLNMIGQTIHLGRFQIARKTEGLETIEDPYLVAAKGNNVPVVIVNTLTDEIMKFFNIQDLMEFTNLKKTTLNWRLNSKGSKVYSDNCRYFRYVDYIQHSPF